MAANEINEINEKKNDTAKQITLCDNEKFDLIHLWEGEDCVYNVEHADSHNNAKRLAVLKRVSEEMSVQSNHVQIKKIMVSLRTSRRKEEDARRTGRGAHHIYDSNWKFYDVLAF